MAFKDTLSISLLHSNQSFNEGLTGRLARHHSFPAYLIRLIVSSPCGDLPGQWFHVLSNPIMDLDQIGIRKWIWHQIWIIYHVQNPDDLKILWIPIQILLGAFSLHRIRVDKSWVLCWYELRNHYCHSCIRALTLCSTGSFALHSCPDIFGKWSSGCSAFLPHLLLKIASASALVNLQFE